MNSYTSTLYDHNPVQSSGDANSGTLNRPPFGGGNLGGDWRSWLQQHFGDSSATSPFGGGDGRFVGPPQNNPFGGGALDGRFIGPPVGNPLGSPLNGNPLPHPGPVPQGGNSGGGNGGLPRPIARARWNPDAANFGQYQDIWQSLAPTWKAELAGFPQSGVNDYLYLLDLARKNQQTTGKNGIVIVDGQRMDPIDAAKYVLDKMRKVAQQIDTSYVNAKTNVANRDKQVQSAPIANRINPITFGR